MFKKSSWWQQAAKRFRNNLTWRKKLLQKGHFWSLLLLLVNWSRKRFSHLKSKIQNWFPILRFRNFVQIVCSWITLHFYMKSLDRCTIGLQEELWYAYEKSFWQTYFYRGWKRECMHSDVNMMEFDSRTMILFLAPSTLFLPSCLLKSLKMGKYLKSDFLNFFFRSTTWPGYNIFQGDWDHATVFVSISFLPIRVVPFKDYSPSNIYSKDYTFHRCSPQLYHDIMLSIMSRKRKPGIEVSKEY